VSEDSKLGPGTEPTADKRDWWDSVFAKGGVVIALLSLIASVIFNIILIRKNAEPSPPAFQYAGSFDSGDLMNHVIEECKRGMRDNPVPPLQIVADFAAYGDFTFSEKFREYIDVLKERSGKNMVSYIVLNKQRRREALLSQFKGFVNQVKNDEAYLKKAENYLASEYPRKAIKKLHLDAKTLSPEKFTVDDIVAVNIEAENLLVEAFRGWGITVKFYPYQLTVHAWSGTRDSAVISIVDWSAGVHEDGFLAQGQAAKDVQTIFRIMDTDSTAQ